MSGGDMSATTQRGERKTRVNTGAAHRSCSCLAGEGRPFERVRRYRRAVVGGEKVCCGVGTTFFLFQAHVAPRGPRPAPRASQVRSSISSPLDADAIRSPNSSIILTRRDRTTACHILSIRFNAARPIAQKDTQLSRILLFFFVFVASCRSRNSKFAHKRVRVSSLSLPFTPFFCSFSCCFSILAISELQHPLIHSVLIPSHRPACGALRPTTRVDARMLGSHERRQINRGLSRACSDSL